MKRLVLLLACSLLAFGSVACGDDSGGGDAAGNNAVNNDANNDVNNDANNDVNNDANNDVNNDANNDVGPECGNGACEAGETPDSCAADCQAGSPDDYDFEVPASFMNDIALETDANVGADLNGDGQPDNALGALLSDLGGLLGDTDLNGQLAEAIADGSLSLGATWPSLKGTGVADNADVDIHFFLLDPAGDGSYTADRASFVPGTASPQITFQGASIAGGSLTAGPSRFALTIPLGEVNLDVVVDGALLEGDISDDNGGVAISNGTLAGAVSLASIVDALNAFLSSDSCSCLGLNGPLIDLDQPNPCVGQFDDATCEAEDQGICSTIAGACPLAVPVIGGQTDIDLNGDGATDAISVFIRIGMEGASITGASAE